jgi:hypothetical protein
LAEFTRSVERLSVNDVRIGLRMLRARSFASLRMTGFEGFPVNDLCIWSMALRARSFAEFNLSGANELRMTVGKGFSAGGFATTFCPFLQPPVVEDTFFLTRY